MRYCWDKSQEDSEWCEREVSAQEGKEGRDARNVQCPSGACREA